MAVMETLDDPLEDPLDGARPLGDVTNRRLPDRSRPTPISPRGRNTEEQARRRDQPGDKVAELAAATTTETATASGTRVVLGGDQSSLESEAQRPGGRENQPPSSWSWE